MGRRRTKGKAPIDELLETSWQVSAIMGVVAYVGLKWILPAIVSGSMLLKPLTQALSGLAGLAGGGLLFISLLVYLKTAVSRRKPFQTVSKTGQLHPVDAWKLPPQPPASEPAAVGGSSITPPGSSHEWGAAEPKAKPAEWSIGLIRGIEWKRFEDVCQRFYAAKGIPSEVTPLGPDGGIDIRLFLDGSGVATSIVQCKAWGERFVGVKPIRELLGVMTHEKIESAFFMTSGKFSDDAKEVAKANRITLIDGDMLLMMINRLPEEARRSLLDFATAGDYRTPTCPGCGIKMKCVPGKGGRPDFWGCHNYPRCRRTLGMRRDI